MGNLVELEHPQTVMNIAVIDTYAHMS